MGFPGRKGGSPIPIDTDWHFEIGPIPEECGSFIEEMKTPWHIPTNFLTIRKRDSAGVTAEEIDSVIFTFRQFLSFAWGRYVGIALARGYSADGQVVFAHWGRTYTDPWVVPVAGQTHWFLPDYAEVLGDILPGYWRRCHEPEWKDAMEWALYWWLSANHVGQVSETAILAAQAGLEAIAPKIVDLLGSRSKKPKGKRTVEKIRELLLLLEAPLDIPGQLKQVRSFATAKGWDGPQVLARVRNSLAHPSKGAETGLAFEASQLGMWYLELTLLFLFAFQGQYSNRTVFEKQFGEREAVPWAASLGPA